MIKSISKIFVVSLIGVLVFTSLPQRSAVAQTVDDETLIHRTIDAYFNLKYEANTDLTPRAFGQLVANTAKAQRFQQHEQDIRDIEYERGKLFNLSYVSYSYTLDYENVQIDTASGTATANLLEGADITFKQAAPLVSQMNREHTITLLKVKDEWKIVEDSYDSFIGDMLDSGATKGELIQLLIKNHEDYLKENKEHAAANALPMRPMSGHTYNRSGAVSYAYNHALTGSYNPAYKNMTPDDCTNFVSQAMYETNPGGGVAMTARNVTPYPWYYASANDWGTAWAGANNLLNLMINYTSTVNGPEGSSTTVEYMQLGDLIFMDQDSCCGATATHVVIVTAIDEIHTVYVSSHTENWRNVPYTNFLPRYSTWFVTVTGW